MLMDIFSSFDEQNFNLVSFIPVVWFLGGGPLFLLQSKYWVHLSRWNFMIFSFMSFMSGQVGRIAGKNISGFLVMMVSIFIFLIIVNLVSLGPYVFSFSSHLSFSFFLGFPLWCSLVMSGIFFNYSSVIGHFLPSGGPAVLNPFLVLVESVSILVRPVTLAIRLTANMSAGHIILGLIGGYLSSGMFFYSYFIILILVVVEIFYFMFEVGVSIIQAYIFSLLVSLYSEDHPI
uniref:ATP synthase subunit a n=1 Tax=Tonicina zschaui TaxID=2719129 RepID=A0A6H1PGK7_9MOLL|nr:ATP synthase F0 subunit 6 [Tonicina zschaui]